MDLVKLIYVVVTRKCLEDVLAIVHQNHPHAFLSIEDLHAKQGGIFPIHNEPFDFINWNRNQK